MNISRKLDLREVNRACIAGVLTSLPNFRPPCGRTKSQ